MRIKIVEEEVLSGGSEQKEEKSPGHTQKLERRQIFLLGKSRRKALSEAENS